MESSYKQISIRINIYNIVHVFIISVQPRIIAQILNTVM